MLPLTGERRGLAKPCKPEMSVLSQLIPNFVREPAISILGEKCYTTLIDELNLADVACLKLAVSKALGIGIVVGGSVMKLPQMFIILSDKSARGLSLSAYTLETAAYAITTIYALRNRFPFSTYGENFFLSLQNIFVTMLIIYYSRPRLASGRESKIPQLLAAVAVAVAAIYALLAAPPTVLQGLQMLTVPLSVLSKLPQISQNYKAQSTGQLSAIAVLSQIAGCAARLFTTITEVRDPIVLAGFLVALVLNLVLGLQMWLYWGQGEEDIDTTFVMEKGSPSFLPQQSSSTSSFASVPPRYHSPTPGRRWARKVD